MASTNQHNRSWLSSSSFESLDSFSKDQQHNSSINSGSSNTNNNGGMPHRTRSRGDRYNHYRRDGPSKVKPWMRDKAITGGGGGSRTGRYGGSTTTTRNNNNVNHTGTSFSIGSSNSVSSASSFQDPLSPSSRCPLPSEVVPTTPMSSRSLVLQDDESITTAPTEEISNSRHDEVQMQQHYPEEIPHTTPKKEEEVVVVVEEEEQQQQEHPVHASSKTVDAHDEIATVDTETNSTTDTPLLQPATGAQRFGQKTDDKNNIDIPTLSSSSSMIQKEVVEDEKSEKEETSSLALKGLDSTTTSSVASAAAAIVSPETTPSEEQQTTTGSSETMITTTPPALEAPISSNLSQGKDESMEVDDEKQEEEFYDVLPSIQPSSYNPFGSAMKTPAIKITTTTTDTTTTGEKHPPVSVSAYASMGKPTLLNDAIAEGSDEETSFDEDIESNINNLSADTLQGIKALDTTREESFGANDDVDFDFSRMEPPDHPLVDAEVQKMWPSCANVSAMPAATFPSDWEQQQTLAAGETHAWIQGQLQQQLQGIDFKASAYSEFAASLSDCPALTTGFFAGEYSAGQCYCPCSVLMEGWRTERLPDTEEFLFDNVLKCDGHQFTPSGLVRHCNYTMRHCGDLESRFLHGIVYMYLKSVFGPSHEAFQSPSPQQDNDSTESDEIAVQARLEAKALQKAASVDDSAEEDLHSLFEANKELLEKLKLAEDSRQQLEAKNIECAAELNTLREQVNELESVNTQLAKKLRLAEEATKELAAKHMESVAAAVEHEAQVKSLCEDMYMLKTSKNDLQEKLRLAEEKGTLQEAKSIENSASAKKLAEELKALETEKFELQKELESAETKNAGNTASLESLTERLQKAEEKHADSVASSAAQAEMMNGLCEEMKQLEQAKAELQKKLDEAQSNESKQTNANKDAQAQIKNLKQEKVALEEANAEMQKNLTAAEDREKAQACQEQNVTLVHVGDMPVDLRRFRVQCQKYFTKLRLAQLKSHCVRDKSPVKLVIEHDPKEVDSIDIQKILDKGAAVESQDATYLFRALDTFNKGHFHTHKLLLPWKIVTTSGGFVSRSEFFVQVWQQIGGLKVNVGEKKTEVPLFQESLGYLIPMPNAVLEGMLRVTPAELNRIFAAKIAPYYRALGRLIVQCIGATADDLADYSLKVAGSCLPMILRQKLFRGVDPVDESYPLEQLLDHAFSLLGMQDMTREKAFEYFSIEAKDCSDMASAVKRIREEVHEMWIKERSLALQALEEGLTLNGLADVSFCCGLVPLEAVNECIFTR